jgi:aminomethyltransferase
LLHFFEGEGKTMKDALAKTPLYEWHIANKANMADFGGYLMPLWYTSAKNEHLAVISGAGVFDTSHMAVLLLAGADSRDLLQLCFTQNLETCTGAKKGPLTAGRCVYGAYLNQNGEVIDDTIVNQTGPGTYMLVVNAGMGGPVAEHLSRNRGNRDVTVRDLTDIVGKMDIQGPAAAKIVKKIISNPESVLDQMPYFSFKGHFDPAAAGSGAVRLKDGTPILLSRTGYTGEFGFEIFVDPAKIVPLWESVLAAGKEFGAAACGLAARDSLRAGAVLPLSHQDIGHWPFVNHPWSFVLPYAADGKGFTKEFIGAKALLGLHYAEHTLPFAGFDLRKVSLPSKVTDQAGNEIGAVLTCVTDMAIGRTDGRIFSIASADKPKGFNPTGLSCGFVKIKNALAPGERILLADARRKIEVEIVRDIRPDRTARRPIREMV